MMTKLQQSSKRTQVALATCSNVRQSRLRSIRAWWDRFHRTKLISKENVHHFLRDKNRQCSLSSELSFPLNYDQSLFLSFIKFRHKI